MQTCAGIEMQVETDNYRPRQLFYHHNFHTNRAQAKSVSWMLLSPQRPERHSFAARTAPYTVRTTILPSDVSLTVTRSCSYSTKFAKT